MRVPFFRMVFLVFGFLACNFSKNNIQSVDVAEPGDSLELIVLELTRQINNDRMNPELFYRRGEVFFRMNKNEEAIDDLKIAIKIDSAKHDYHFLLADIYFSERKVAMAKDELEKCLGIDSNDKDARLKLAEIYLLMQNREKTSEILRKVLDIDVANPLAFYLLGIHFKETGDTGRAISSFQKAVEYNSSYYDAYLEAGILMMHKKNKDAISYIDAALNLRPGSVEAHYAAGMYYQGNNDPEKALSHYRSILSVDSVNDHAWYNAGYVYCTLQEKFNDAIPCFTRAVEINPMYAEAYYMRGLCYEATGNKTLAKENYLIALRYKENYELAIKGLNRLDVQ